MKTSRGRRFVLLTAVASVLPGSGLGAESTSTLRRVSELIAGWQSALNERASGGSAEDLVREVTAFEARASRLAPAEAAEQWLKLVDAFLALDPAARMQLRGGGGEPLSFRAVLAVMPPVAAWPELAAAIRRRPVSTPKPAAAELGLRLLAARLTDDAQALTETREPLAKTFPGAADERPERRLWHASAADAEAPGAIVAEFTRQVEVREQGNNAALNFMLAVPDLVTLAGREEARRLLERVVVLPVAMLQVGEGRETGVLARDVALERIADLKVPRWELAARPGSSALFEALLKRFGAPSEAQAGRGLPFHDGSGGGFAEARGYYLIDLVLAGRTDDAMRVAVEVKSETAQAESWMSGAFEALERTGRDVEVAEFFHALLAQRPELPFWDRYVTVAARAGRSAEALALLQKAAATTTLTAEQRAGIARHLAGALLAADRVDEGVAELRRAVAAKVEPQRAGEFSFESFHMLQRTEQLAALGALLQQPAWVDEAVAGMRRRMETDVTQNAAMLPGFAHTLAERGRFAEAIELLDLALRKTAQLTRGDERYSVTHLQPPLLGALAHVYHLAGRSEDVLTLLNEAPYWNSKDVAGVTSLPSGVRGKQPTNLAFITASALAKTGRMAEAREVLDFALRRDGGFDPAYALLLELGGAETEAKLDALARRDRFEERPLIWKAEWLRRAGRLEEAEALARAAIAIDPSDGEQPHGDRMRVYGVLAEIRAARGDAAQAEFFRGVVRAIRLAEEADRLHQAGLLSRAIALYRQALTHFSDAYCIQSRLAVQLNELGRFAEAEEHYRKAYELMPESFGRVESHCFGCERAFGPERAQSVAERVFASLVQKTPQKPQVHYLLGYLRMEQGRANEALPLFRRAAELDPDYLSAWKKIGELGAQMRLPTADREAAALNLLRLDPLRRHSHAMLGEVRDLRALFTRIEAVRAAFPAEPATVYPLRASREKLERDAKGSPVSWSAYSMHSDESGKPVSASNVVRQHGFFTSLAEVVDAVH